MLLALVPIAFGVLVEVRGALLQTRRTDLAVFARAAWAVRNGVDVYSVTDEKGLHYHYPPLLAIVMMPVADPPPGVPAINTVPFAITVGIWYLLSVCAAFLSVHTLGNALVASSKPLAARIGPRWSKGWWGLRVVPLLVCLPYLGHALVIGQINVLWMALACWMAAALLRGQRFRAGLWLAAAICVKVIPVFLLIYPIWRRDRRCLAGTLSGLILGLAVVPVAALGVDGAWRATRTWSDVMLMPVLGRGSDLSRDQELLGVWSTHNQALAPTIHKTIHVLSDPRPERMTPFVQITGMSIGLLLTSITLIAAGWRAPGNLMDEVLFLGALNINMLSLSPGGHPHYLLLLVPLIAGLMASAWARGASILVDPLLRVFMVAGVIASALPLIVQRAGIGYDLGLPLYSALLFWGAACHLLWHDRHAINLMATPVPSMPSHPAQVTAA